MTARPFGEIARSLVARTEAMRSLQVLLQQCPDQDRRDSLIRTAREINALSAEEALILLSDPLHQPA